MDPNDAAWLLEHAASLVQHTPLAYEPVAAPCSLMNCGDVVHRSTLDLVLRKEVHGLDWRVFPAAIAVLIYLFATPGVLPGAVDYYLLAGLQRRQADPITKEDLKLGKRLGSGGFGSVYKATLKAPDGSSSSVIVKKAKEFGEAEVWMNERMARASPGSCARFLGAFLDSPPAPAGLSPAAAAGVAPSCVWLVWRDEGEATLADLLARRDFPYCLEPLLLGRELRLPKDKRRRLVTVKLVLRQLLEGLEAAHATGIVHRDIKPQNAILSTAERRLKLIDWGAAADLRLGINYVPNEYLLDPRYAPPQQYVMSRQTASPPPKPVAALLSPVLWAMERPDKFDMYSAGILLLQLAFPNLRSDNSLVAFNRRLQQLGWDLQAWKREVLLKHPKGLPREAEEGFELLEAEGGAGWQLACSLVAYSPSERPSASEALASPFFDNMPAALASAAGSGTGSVLVAAPAAAATAARALSSTVGSTMGSVSRKVTEVIPAGMLEDALIHSDQQGLTEAWLVEEFGWDRPAPGSSSRPGGGAGQQRETIAWFMDRQSELQQRLVARQAQLRRTIRGVQKRLAGGSSSPSSSRPGSSKLRVRVPAALAPADGRKKPAAAAAADDASSSSGGGLLSGLLPLGLLGGARAKPPSATEVDLGGTPAAAGNGKGVMGVRELLGVFGGRK